MLVIKELMIRRQGQVGQGGRVGQVLLEPLSFSVAAGEVLTLMGASGAGKSTILNWLIGALPAAFEASGEVWLNGQCLNGLPVEQRRVGILFQDDLLFPHMSVGDNLAFALPSHIQGRAARRAHLEAVLDTAGLEGFYGRDPATLSGGQRARVSALRALLAEPQALLLDEPFSRLDAALREQFRAFVFGRIAGLGIPAVLVTHDVDDVPAGGGLIRVQGGRDV